MDGFRSLGVDSSGKNSFKCLKPSKNEPTPLGGDLVVQKVGKRAIFHGPGAVEDALEDDRNDYLPGGMCDGT